MAAGKSGGSSAGAASGGNSAISGPTGGGQASGARRAGMTPGSGFQREKLKPSELAQGSAVGVFTVDGESLAGEVSLPKGKAAHAAVDKLAEEMEKEPIPIEHRDQIRQYQEFVRRGAGSGGEE